jgi:Carboxypeptidase regulatory-like domain
MRRLTLVVLFLLAGLAVGAPAANAQGGGASQTGTIIGKVTDSSDAALPGVTITITSASLMGAQTQVTNESGNYRFPAVPPGNYTVKYELAGFSTLVREGIDVALGFTATVNVQLAVATLQETVTVTGESPVVDTSATRVQQNFKLEQLQTIPNARDMWSLLAVSPAVVMARVDVGGNRAGTQTGYNAYGYNGQVRVLVEGINTTEGTGGAGFYFDYGSFEEVFLGTAGQGAEMPNPGVQSQFLGKSGGNRFQGEIYLDYENNAMQGSNLEGNIPDKWVYDPVSNPGGIRLDSNQIDRYRDFNINVGGPIKKDKVWWYFSYRDQFNAVAQPNFQFDKTFDTTTWNLSGKGTYQVNQNNKLVGYYQWGQKIQPNRLPFADYVFSTPDDTWRQDSGSWVYKAEWNSTISDRLYLEARYGDFGYYFPLVAVGDASNTYYARDTGTRTLTGGDQRQQLDRDRKQGTAAATYFKDNLLGGNHSFKFGGEVLLETSWNGYLSAVDGHIEHLFNNGAANQVILDFPTALEVDKLGAHKDGGLASIAKLDHMNAFLSDQYSRGRLTLNVGLRWDRYKAHIPEQEQFAFSILPGCEGRTDIICAIPAAQFPAQTFTTWNSVVPRAGLVFDITGDGKTVVKANYGLYRHNPGATLAADANPNQALKTITYTWRDLNGDRQFQIGEQQGNATANALAGAVSVDQDLKQPYSHEISVFLEREIAQNLGGRVGFVYKTNDDLFEQEGLAARPHSLYTQPFNFNDVGPDGVAGGGDDRVIQLLGIPPDVARANPATSVVMNVDRPERFRTVEASVVKRLSNRWSANVGGAFTWLHDFPNTIGGGINNNYPPNPNGLFDAEHTRWDFKVSGIYDGPWGIRFSPVFRHQAGAVFGRSTSVSSTNPVLGATTVYMTGYDLRQDNITILDLRTEKVVNLRDSMRVRLFLDLFNITNSHAAETISTATGINYLRPTAIVAPRVARVGFRFMW